MINECHFDFREGAGLFDKGQVVQDKTKLRVESWGALATEEYRRGVVDQDTNITCNLAQVHPRNHLLEGLEASTKRIPDGVYFSKGPLEVRCAKIN